jgi:formate hydrogenlyase subunit 3/multisubunit Na+/H+ antiporter MnhD subunit
MVFEGAVPGLAGGRRTVVLLVALAGFGVKAGIVPLHVWLPEAHAAAPSHVSALMSGVVIKMGVYGIARASLLASAPAWWGATLAALGVAGALTGITLASYQRDLKRALAYSSVENIGLVVLGLGIGLWGRASGDEHLAALGLAAGLLHAWNHTLMKGLLFLGAGAIVHATGTKDLERLGGLMKRMPFAATLFGLGTIAIAGLPPFNGFAGEWLLYRSLLDGAAGAPVGPAVVFMLAVGALSLVGALAALCFVRLASVVLSRAWPSGPARRR